jgi:hypothetical protein
MNLILQAVTRTRYAALYRFCLLITSVLSHIVTVPLHTFLICICFFTGSIVLGPRIPKLSTPCLCPIALSSLYILGHERASALRVSEAGHRHLIQTSNWQEDLRNRRLISVCTEISEREICMMAIPYGLALNRVPPCTNK